MRHGLLFFRLQGLSQRRAIGIIQTEAKALFDDKEFTKCLVEAVAFGIRHYSSKNQF